ncbi:hypothetical protein DRP05_11350 [Archaeoglobales archaeon]|nr:MAG: hypothetical protein DRP05_11350 [Archaeoglobales archaeon]
MDVRIVKVKDMFKPEDELMVIRIGEFTIIKKHKTLSDILNETSKKFEDLSEEDKERLAIEAKKWVREKLRS